MYLCRGHPRRHQPGSEDNVSPSARQYVPETRQAPESQESTGSTHSHAGRIHGDYRLLLQRGCQTALVAGIAVLNLTDFFAFGSGVSLAIPAAARPGIYTRVRRILQAEHLPGALARVVVSAVARRAAGATATGGGWRIPDRPGARRPRPLPGLSRPGAPAVHWKLLSLAPEARPDATWPAHVGRSTSSVPMERSGDALDKSTDNVSMRGHFVSPQRN
jgi:hypothetical protein